MKENSARLVVEEMKAAGINYVVQLPDTGLFQIHTLCKNDPYFNYVILLVQPRGADASTAFYDDSLRNATVSTVGNAQVDNAQAPTGMSVSMLLDGTGDYVSVPHSTLFDPGAVGVDYTFEAWIRKAVTKANNTIFNKRATSGAATGVSISISGTDNLVCTGWWSGSNGSAVSVGTLANNTWYHIACERVGSLWTNYINGVADGTFTQPAALLTSSNIQRVGRDAFSTARDFNGWLGPVRITRGVARYGQNFTVPTLPLPLGGVQQASVARRRRIQPRDPYYGACVSIMNFRGADNSTAAVTYDAAPVPRNWTLINTPNISHTKYKYGVSSLRVANTEGLNTGSPAIENYIDDFWIEKDYTMEFWMNFDAIGSGDVLASMRETSPAVNAWKFWKQADNSLRFVAWNNSQIIIDLTTAADRLNANQWYHCAMSRHKTTWRLFVDGTLEDEVIETETPIRYTTGGVRLFRDIVTTATDYFAGYCGGIRFTKGVARYTQNFSVPDRLFPER